MVSAVAPVKKRRIRLWHVLLGGFSFFCLLALAPIVAFTIWSSGHQDNLNTMLAEIKARGEPLTGDQIAFYFQLEPGAEDVTAV